MRSMVLWLAIAVGCGGKTEAVENRATQPAAPSSDAELQQKLVKAEHDRDDAERRANDATKVAQEALEKVEKIQRDVEELDRKVTTAVDSVVAAQTDADRATAKARLEQLQRDKAEMEARIKAAKDAAQRAKRKQGSTISKECMDNPLAKGCS